ncbi:unnamed protein product [Effrenium voratum]|nr:unnamed protein product [Effrenium voratum]
MRCLHLLWLLCLACAGAAEESEVDRGFWHISKIFWGWMLGVVDVTPEEMNKGRVRQPLKIIGAGFGRTGTSSMAMAMERLGYRPYHWVEGMMTMGHIGLWANWYRAVHANKQPAIDIAFNKVSEAIADGGFNVTLDFPACLAFDSFMDKYPDAKVLLTVRSSGDAWAKSVLAGVIDMTWSAQGRLFDLTPRLNDMRLVVMGGWPLIGQNFTTASELPNETLLASVYENWIVKVKKTVPPEKLLIHEAKDGYGPLCKFMEIPEAECPKEPYPHLNASKDQWIHRIITYIFMRRGCEVAPSSQRGLPRTD